MWLKSLQIGVLTSQPLYKRRVGFVLRSNENEGENDRGVLCVCVFRSIIVPHFHHSVSAR